MRISSIITLLIAVGMGFLSVFAMNRQGGQAKPVDNSVEVIAAKADIPRGTLVSAVMLEKKKVSKEVVGENVIKDAAAAEDRIVMESMSKGEILYDQRLAPKGQKGLANQITEGMRAFTIETPRDSTSISGLIVPGNRVDVILNVTAQMNKEVTEITGGGTSMTLLQNLEVLAVDNRFDGAAPVISPNGLGAPTTREMDYKAVTLLVTQQQATILTLGQSRGSLHLTLRHPNDNSVESSDPTLFKDIQFGVPFLEALRKKAGVSSLEFAERRDGTPADSDSVETTDGTAKAAGGRKISSTRPISKRIRILRGQSEQSVIHQSIP